MPPNGAAGELAPAYPQSQPQPVHERMYDRLPAARRALLHRRIGERLESGYRSRIEEITGDLALHFEIGHDHGPWLSYSRKAGLAHISRAASPEGLRHLQAALRALEHLAEGSERSAQELELLNALGPALISLKGFNAPEVERYYQRALHVSSSSGTGRQRLLRSSASGGTAAAPRMSRAALRLANVC